MPANHPPQILGVLIKALETGEIESAFNLANELRWVGTYVKPSPAPVDLSSHSLILKPILSHEDAQSVHYAASAMRADRIGPDGGATIQGAHELYTLCFREALIAKLKEIERTAND